jgi:hypothetical protein
MLWPYANSAKRLECRPLLLKSRSIEIAIGESGLAIVIRYVDDGEIEISLSGSRLAGLPQREQS